ncbi:hypothetical protein PY257_06425 [Ramlibacter sp. H39-3-26]|uniref:hypothetical protein n=1 Tax=Curvibacter soli TaxID=3031331 RepID=UPI0023DB01F1|nr:hypothetical protein [Ramlibacter sp. H39-3-26]MDF1484825.1 hypothetical protein [Ramlibacter sp. H39-3-26]
MSGSNLSNPTAATAMDEPLGLTVHALPAPGDVAALQRTRSGRWKMLALLLVCAAPVIASYFTYYVVRPEGRRVFGALVEPQRPLPDLPAHDLQGRATNLQALGGQWLLLSVADAACNALCQRNLYLQRQLREAMGRDKDRVDWVWLVTGDGPVSDALQPALQQADVLRVDAAALAQWLQAAPGHALDEHLYVVDPLGHWMMRFPPQIDAQGAVQAKRDLERLLRASSAWDQAGRAGPP